MAGQRHIVQVMHIDRHSSDDDIGLWNHDIGILLCERNTGPRHRVRRPEDPVVGGFDAGALTAQAIANFPDVLRRKASHSSYDRLASEIRERAGHQFIEHPGTVESL